MRIKAFTLIELLVVLGTVALLLAVVVPYAAALREQGRRTECAANLMRIRDALNVYADANGQNFPRVRQNADAPARWTAFTGADDADPFSGDGPQDVRLGDVTASLWLLVRMGAASPADFICPSTGMSPDPLTDAQGRPVDASKRGNFRSPNNLSYSYADPFSADPSYRLNKDVLPPEFALVADLNPGKFAGDRPAFDADPLALAVSNSPNHGGSGQNVLFVVGQAYWKTSPFVGPGLTKPPGGLPKADGDDIYSALQREPVKVPETPALNGRGVFSRDAGPAQYQDSFLVPGVVQ